MEWLQRPVVQGAIAGAIAAALVDLAAFRAWKSWQDAASYAWGTATFRWFQGAVVGALSSVGINAVI